MWETTILLTEEEVRKETQLYSDVITETVNLFLPNQSGHLLYMSSHYEAALCYLLNNSRDCQGSPARYMNFNRPVAQVYFIHTKLREEVGDDEVTALWTSLRSAPYPVVLDSQMTGAHHRIWRGHGSQRNKDDPLDMKCRDAFGVFPTLAFQLKAWPDSILQTMEARIQMQLYDTEIMHELQMSPCYETLDCGETRFAFPHGELILLNALPTVYRQSYLMLHMFFSTQFHHEVANISQLLLHALLWTYEDLSARVVTKDLIWDHIISKYLLHDTLSNYFVEEQKMQIDHSATFSKIAGGNILSCVDFTLKNQGELRQSYTAYLKDRINCTVKLQILRLRKHTCDAILDTGVIDEWLDAHKKDRPNLDIIKKMVNSWKLSLQVAKKCNETKLKRKLKGYVEQITDTRCEGLEISSLILGSILYKLGEYQKAFDTVEPIAKLCLPSVSQLKTTSQSVNCKQNAMPIEDLYISTPLSDPDFLQKTLVVQSLSLVMVSDPELVAHKDFITHDETRMAKSPLAGEMPNNITGVFSLSVFTGCLYSLCLWRKYLDDDKAGVPDADLIKNKALEILQWLEDLIEHLGVEPWDGNDKRYCSHLNMVGRCYLILEDQKRALKVFARSDRSFPIRFSTAGTMVRKIQKDLDKKESGSYNKTWVVAGVCGAAAAAVGIFKFVSK